ncbi:hypothetical protein SDC9_171317 [bioreactor metagenome]|uniref:DUF5698 domain-containing protein n=1 Tax=bioreactor metagenome TaxID=1076179 RepID=A0A645GJ46_9ZZZZ
MTLALSIIGINIVYVSLNTLRTILVIKGQRLLAAMLSIVEVGIYLLGLTIVLQNLTSLLNIAAYCAGFGAGVYIGSCLEQRLALGYVNVQVIVNSTDCNLPSLLREEGYGVTSWQAQGRDGDRLVLQVLAKRSNEKSLLAFLQSVSPNAFIISYEPKNFVGGFWTKHIRTF